MTRVGVLFFLTFTSIASASTFERLDRDRRNAQRLSEDQNLDPNDLARQSVDAFRLGGLKTACQLALRALRIYNIQGEAPPATLLETLAAYREYRGLQFEGPRVVADLGRSENPDKVVLRSFPHGPFIGSGFSVVDLPEQSALILESSRGLKVRVGRKHLYLQSFENPALVESGPRVINPEDLGPKKVFDERERSEVSPEGTAVVNGFDGVGLWRWNGDKWVKAWTRTYETLFKGTDYEVLIEPRIFPSPQGKETLVIADVLSVAFESKLALALARFEPPKKGRTQITVLVRINHQGRVTKITKIPRVRKRSRLFTPGFAKWSPDGSRVVVLVTRAKRHDDVTVFGWIMDRELNPIAAWETGSSAKLTPIVFSGDGRVVAVGFEKGFQYFNALSGDLLGSIEAELVFFSPDATYSVAVRRVSTFQGEPPRISVVDRNGNTAFSHEFGPGAVVPEVYFDGKNADHFFVKVITVFPRPSRSYLQEFWIPQKVTDSIK